MESAPTGSKSPADLLAVLQKLYAAEVNISIESDWDNGYTVSLGNLRYGFAAAEHFDARELVQVPQWLEDKAREIYPKAFEEPLRGGGA